MEETVDTSKKTTKKTQKAPVYEQVLFVNKSFPFDTQEVLDALENSKFVCTISDITNRKDVCDLYGLSKLPALLITDNTGCRVVSEMKEILEIINNAK